MKTELEKKTPSEIAKDYANNKMINSRNSGFRDNAYESFLSGYELADQHNSCYITDCNNKIEQEAIAFRIWSYKNDHRLDEIPGIALSQKYELYQQFKKDTEK